MPIHRRVLRPVLVVFVILALALGLGGSVGDAEAASTYYSMDLHCKGDFETSHWGTGLRYKADQYPHDIGMCLKSKLTIKWFEQYLLAVRYSSRGPSSVSVGVHFTLYTPNSALDCFWGRYRPSDSGDYKYVTLQDVIVSC